MLEFPFKGTSRVRIKNYRLQELAIITDAHLKNNDASVVSRQVSQSSEQSLCLAEVVQKLK